MAGLIQAMFALPALKERGVRWTGHWVNLKSHT